MANELALTAANIRDASPANIRSVIETKVAGVAITAGQVVYENTSGKWALATAAAAGTAVARGIALKGVAAGEVLDVLAYGYCYGFTLTSESYGELMKLSNTAGAIDDGGGSPTVSAPIGRVTAMDNAQTKVLFVNCLYNLNVLPA